MGNQVSHPGGERPFDEDSDPRTIPLGTYLVALFMLLFLAIISQLMYQALELLIAKVFNGNDRIEWVHIFNFAAISLMFLAIFILLIRYVITNPLSLFY